MKKLILLFVACFISTHLSAKEKSRSMDQMKGNCADYKMDLSNEFKSWEKSAAVISTDQSLNIGSKLTLQLQPQSKVQFVVAPEKNYGDVKTNFASIAPFKVNKDGAYRISAGSKIWYDVIETKTKKTVEATEFEMQTKCQTIFKTVIFSLKNNTDYTLQISGSSKPTTDILISNIH